MDSSDAIHLAALLILLCLSAFFSSAETSLTTVNRIRMRTLADEGNKRAKTVLKIVEDSGKMLSAVLIGNNIVNLSASSLATSYAIDKFGNAGAGIATGILTLLVLIFGEISPKTLATIHSEKLSLAYSHIIYALMVVLTPVIFLVNKLSVGVLFLLRVNPKQAHNTMTENELRTYVEVGHEEGVIETEEREMINNVFDFGDSLAKDIMVPRADITFANINLSYEEIMDIYRVDHFTRIPVYEDSKDNVVGILNMKDLLLLKDVAHFNIRDVMRDAFYTYEYKKTSELLLEVKQESFSMVIVLDEYGSTSGLITLEDLVEEIVGEIRDEFDENEDNIIRQISEYEYLVEGSLKLDDLNDHLHLDLESEDYDSVGGLFIDLLGDLPDEGDKVATDNRIVLVVDKMDNKRIETVHIYLPQQTDSSEENESI